MNTRGLIVALPLFRQTITGGGIAQELNVLDFDCNNVTFPIRNQTASWRVTAVICRTTGSLEDGHYWVYRRVPDTERDFIKISDETITEPPTTYETFTCLPSAYVMFMERN